MDSLCTKLLSGKREQERDVAAIGLKTVVTDLPSGAVATLVVRRLCPKLVAGVQRKARRAARCSLRPCPACRRRPEALGACRSRTTS